MKVFGLSMDLSTCVSAAKLNIAIGFKFFNNFNKFFLLLISNLKNL